MVRHELQAMRKFLDENLEKGFIRLSLSPVACPVLFVKKQNSDMRLCVNYWKLNSISVHNRYPILSIKETLHRLAKAKFYTHLDIIIAFNML